MDYAKNYLEWWQGVLKEEQAKAEKMDAEERLSHNKMLEDFNTEAAAATDWVEADWDQFKARVQQWTNSAQIKADELV